MTNAVPQFARLTAALLATLSQWYGDGMSALKDNRLPDAREAFTRVACEPVTPNPLYELALYWRAEAAVRAADTNAAITDIRLALEAAPAGAMTRLAAERYQTLTGEAWGGLVLVSPESTWHSFVKAARSADLNMLLKCCGGSMQNDLRDVLAGPASLKEITDELETMTLKQVTYNSNSNKACLVLAKANSAREERLLLSRDADRWLLVDEFDPSVHRDFTTGGHAVAPQLRERFEEDGLKIRSLEAGLRQYVMANQTLPAQLEDVAPYVKDFEATRVSAVDGKPFVIACPAGDDVPWLFTATSTNGLRQVYINGQIQTIDDERFAALARDHGIRLPRADIDAGSITDAERALIQKLIAQLGAPSYRDRHTAYAQLDKLGPIAAPLLRKAAESKDPEIAIQAKKLLGE